MIKVFQEERWMCYKSTGKGSFGDDFADMRMLRLCGTGVAMGNGVEEVKKAADVVIGSNEEEGIAEYLASFRYGIQGEEKEKIDFSTITACGESCANCPKKANGICKGCIEADGYVPEWADSGRCKVHACTRVHNVQFCGICENFPCQQLTSLIHWNPNIVEHLSRLAKQYGEQDN